MNKALVVVVISLFVGGGTLLLVSSVARGAAALSGSAGPSPPSSESAQDLDHVFDSVYANLAVDALVAFSDGTFPSELLLVLEVPGSLGEAHIHHFTGLAGGVVEDTLGLPVEMQSGRIHATFWWGSDFSSLPPFESALFEDSSAPYAAQRTRFASNGQLSLGRMTLSLPPRVARVAVAVPEPVRFVVASDEAGTHHPLGLCYDAIHDTSFDLCSWSREPSWWLAAVTAGGTHAFSSELTRDSTVTVSTLASGSITGVVDAQLDADGWTVVMIPPYDDGTYTDLSPHPSLPAIVMSAMIGNAQTQVEGGMFAFEGLAASEYTAALIAPGYELHSYSVIQVPAGGAATLSFQ